MSKLDMLRNKGDEPSEPFRITDFPMHYFAAIQTRNQENIIPKLAAIDLSPMEWRILATLNDRERCTVNEIADVTATDRFKVSRAIKTLTDKGLVTEQDDTTDRRRRRAVLTPDGAQAFARAFDVMKGVYLKNFDGISDEEFDVLMRLLRRIKDNVYRTEAY